MTASALSHLLAFLDLAQVGENDFRGTSPAEPIQRVFGGQVLGQALIAASRTVDSRRACHSFHAYFLRPGDPSVPILYAVDRSRDGGSFSARRVVASQHGAAIFTLASSFQLPETGFEHQSQMPVVPSPESLEDDQQVLLRDPGLSADVRAWVARERAFETRSVLGRGLGDRPARPAVDHIWLKARGALPDDAVIHRALLAFVSDMSLRTPHSCRTAKASSPTCRLQAWIMRCGFIVPFVPTNGFFMRRIRLLLQVRGALTAAHSIRPRACWWRRWRRKD